MRGWLVFLIAVALGANVEAASVEARLIRASNTAGKTDEQLLKLEPKLKKVFGYEHYEQLGIRIAPLKEKNTQRLDLGEGFVMFITPKGVDKKKHVLDFELYSGRAALVKSSVQVGEHCNVLVKGPEVGSTLLVLSLTVVE